MHVLLGVFTFCLSIYSSLGQTMKFDEFDAQHYAVYMTYIIAHPGRTSINLIDKNENWVIHVNPRYQSDLSCDQQSAMAIDNYYNGNQKSAMAINSYFNEQWQTGIQPTGFPFPYNQKTSVFVVPETKRYRITFDVGAKNYVYYFPYRNGHKPQQVTRLYAVMDKMCSNILPQLLSFGAGYRITSTLSVGKRIHVAGVAPSTGEIVIDLSLGEPEKKDDVEVALRIKATFGAEPGLYLQSVTGADIRSKSFTNPIQNGSRFCLDIVVRPDVYEVMVRKKSVGTFPSRDNNMGGKASTVWVKGVTILHKIQVF